MQLVDLDATGSYMGQLVGTRETNVVKFTHD